MKDQIKGLLFDKDGTLIDFSKTWPRIYRALATEVAGGDPDLTAVLLRAGGQNPESDAISAGSIFSAAGVDDVSACFAELLGDRCPANLKAVIMRNFRDGGAKHAVLIDGVIEQISTLSGLGYRLGLATNDTRDGLHASLGRFGNLVESFEFFAGCDSGHGPKPGPGMGIAFAQAIGADPACCAIIGDAVHDLEMGKRARFELSIGVLTGPFSRQDLEPYADVVLDSVLDLADFFVRAAPG